MIGAKQNICLFSLLFPASHLLICKQTSEKLFTYLSDIAYLCIVCNDTSMTMRRSRVRCKVMTDYKISGK